MSETDLNTEVEKQAYRAARKAMGDEVEIDTQLEEQLYTAFVEAGVGQGGGGGGTMGTTFTVSNAVGTYEVGDTVQATDAISSVVKNMLTYVTPPTWTNPSASVTLSPSTTLYEIGATPSVTATVGFSRGVISNGDGTTGNRAGAATGYKLTVNGTAGSEQASNSFSLGTVSTNTTLKGTVLYAAGDQPKDSNGDAYGDPLPAGSVDSSQKSIAFVYAVWANTANISTVAKLSLQTSGTFTFSFPTAPAATPEIFDVPAAWTVSSIQVKNDLSGAWEDASAQFTATDTTHDDAGGTSVNYKRYSSNIGDVGARQIKITCTGI